MLWESCQHFLWLRKGIFSCSFLCVSLHCKCPFFMVWIKHSCLSLFYTEKTRFSRSLWCWWDMIMLQTEQYTKIIYGREGLWQPHEYIHKQFKIYINLKSRHQDKCLITCNLLWNLGPNAKYRFHSVIFIFFQLDSLPRQTCVKFIQNQHKEDEEDSVNRSWEIIFMYPSLVIQRVLYEEHKSKTARKWCRKKLYETQETWGTKCDSIRNKKHEGWC